MRDELSVCNIFSFKYSWPHQKQNLRLLNSLQLHVNATSDQSTLCGYTRLSSLLQGNTWLYLLPLMLNFKDIIFTFISWLCIFLKKEQHLLPSSVVAREEINMKGNLKHSNVSAAEELILTHCKYILRVIMGDFPLLGFQWFIPSFTCAVPLLPSMCSQR